MGVDGDGRGGMSCHSRGRRDVRAVCAELHDARRVLHAGEARSLADQAGGAQVARDAQVHGWLWARRQQSRRTTAGARANKTNTCTGGNCRAPGAARPVPGAGTTASHAVRGVDPGSTTGLPSYGLPAEGVPTVGCVPVICVAVKVLQQTLLRTRGKSQGSGAFEPSPGDRVGAVAR